MKVSEVSFSWKRVLKIGGIVTSLLLLIILLNQAHREKLVVSGFSMEYPRAWILEEDKSGTFASVREQKGHARVSITAITEPRLANLESRIAVVNEIERDFTLDPTHTLGFFKWLTQDRAAAINGYTALGTLPHSGVPYHFTEMGFLAGMKVVKIRTEVQSEFLKDLEPMILTMLLTLEGPSNVLESLMPAVSSDAAIERVRNLPYVAGYESMLQQRSRALRFQVEEREDVWIVRAYAPVELLPGGESITGRWSVDKITGVVSQTTP